ncbi:MAG: hypothetical protein C4550_06980 [Nitrospiraceae bacterium]|nr:MAG: hypothetical protein C4550_06980 [Nitrospiraceae bacterium]
MTRKKYGFVIWPVTSIHHTIGILEDSEKLILCESHKNNLNKLCMQQVNKIGQVEIAVQHMQLKI